jgi:regulator of protease activity HflC (stomatin/prohibitin superfamily)
MIKFNSLATLIFIIIAGIGVAAGYSVFGVTANPDAGIWTALFIAFIGFIISSAVKIANQWERAVILRLGNFNSLKGPGLFFIIPIIDRISHWIDMRVITTTFRTEKTLTKDTVPVDVDAVLFWKVIDPKKAALSIIPQHFIYVR